MGDNVGTCIPTIEAQAERQLLQTGRLAQEREEDGSPKVNVFIAVIETRIFLQECIRRSMQSAFSLPILTCSTVSELELGLKGVSAAIVIVSWMEASNEASANALQSLSELAPPSLSLSPWLKRRRLPARRSLARRRFRTIASAPVLAATAPPSGGGEA
jgi:hypothetical protein